MNSEDVDRAAAATADREELARRAQLLQTVSVGRWWATAGTLLMIAGAGAVMIARAMARVAGGEVAGQDVFPEYCGGDPGSLTTLMQAICERGWDFEQAGFSSMFTAGAVAFGLLGAFVTAIASAQKTRAEVSRLAGSVDEGWLRNQRWLVRWATKPYLELVDAHERTTAHVSADTSGGVQVPATGDEASSEPDAPDTDGPTQADPDGGMACYPTQP